MEFDLRFENGEEGECLLRREDTPVETVMHELGWPPWATKYVTKAGALV